MARLIRNYGGFKDLVVGVCIYVLSRRKKVLGDRIGLEMLHHGSHHPHLNLTVLRLYQIHAVHGLERRGGQVELFRPGKTVGTRIKDKSNRRRGCNYP